MVGFLVHFPCSVPALRSSSINHPAVASADPDHSLKTQQHSPHFTKWVAAFPSRSLSFALSTTLAISLSLTGIGFAEAKVGVNKPELLPKDFTPVIDVAGFLSEGQENRIAQEITAIEKDTGFKLRVLAQNYPDTPGLAIKDYWQVDDRTIVFVADPTFGNILNFNVGDLVDLDIPRSFWSRLAGKYGNMFYWKEKMAISDKTLGEGPLGGFYTLTLPLTQKPPFGSEDCIAKSPSFGGNI